MTFSWSSPAPTLRNGVITGYSLSCVPEVGGRNSISMQYTTGALTLRGFIPATSYNCSISASNIWGNGPMAYRMVSTLNDCKHALFLEQILFAVVHSVENIYCIPCYMSFSSAQTVIILLLPATLFQLQLNELPSTCRMWTVSFRFLQHSLPGHFYHV